MKRIMFILGVSIIMALLTVTAALAGWWLGASLPLDISDTTRQIAQHYSPLLLVHGYSIL